MNKKTLKKILAAGIIGAAVSALAFAVLPDTPYVLVGAVTGVAVSLIDGR